MTTPEISDDALIVTRTDGIVVVTLNRPQQANSLDANLMRDLRLLWRSLADDPTARCIVVTGAGRFFCAGADMTLLASDRTNVGADADDELAFLPGDTVTVPVIVAVNGTCAGGGLHFVADADIVIAASSARFIDPHVTVGQVSGIEPVELMMAMRPDLAVRMALLGRHEVLDAERALSAGLVSEVLDEDALMDRAMTLARQICTGSPAALRHTRRVIRAYRRDAIHAYRDLGWELVQKHWSHPDSKEGPAAFQEKREPRWLER